MPAVTLVEEPPEDRRRRTADLVFQGALAYTVVLTLVWAALLLAGARGGAVFSRYTVDAAALARVAFGFLFFSILWGFVWWGVKSLALRFLAGFSREERQQAFSSRMKEPFDLQGLLARHSERRIRIADTIGRRGRFITLQLAGFFYLYHAISARPEPGFLAMALQDNLFDAVVMNWVALALYYPSHFLSRAFWGAQSRVMDGGLARANCLLITMLWSAFKFVMVPIGARLADHFPPSTFAVLYMLIWGSYVAADALSEIVGSLFGKQKLKVWGVGDVNRKSVAGTVAGFGGALALGVGMVVANGLPPAWLGLAAVVAVSSTLLELYSPRGTDDFTMATGNALICWAFGALFY
jgi:hypothetical protein